jgi:hypothetical protein
MRFPYTSPLNPGCLIDCGSSHIIVNQEREYAQPDELGIPTNFFYTDPTNLPYLPPGDTYYPIDKIILHELGHWLGFGHSNEPDDKGNQCGNGGSIMESGDTWGDHPEWRTITAGDRCMFKKLYCCNTTREGGSASADDAPEETFSFTVVPNPIHGTSLVLSLSDFPALHGSELHVSISDISGAEILHRTLSDTKASPRTDISTIPNGTYLITVTLPGKVLSQKIIIQR